MSWRWFWWLVRRWCCCGPSSSSFLFMRCFFFCHLASLFLLPSSGSKRKVGGGAATRIMSLDRWVGGDAGDRLGGGVAAVALPLLCCFCVASSLYFFCSLCQQCSSLSVAASWRCWWWRPGELILAGWRLFFLFSSCFFVVFPLSVFVSPPVFFVVSFFPLPLFSLSHAFYSPTLHAFFLFCNCPITEAICCFCCWNGIIVSWNGFEDRWWNNALRRHWRKVMK